MKTVIGSLGWLTLLVLPLAFAACDNKKASCGEVATKVTECNKEQLGQVPKSLQDELKKELDGMPADVQKQCEAGDDKKIEAFKKCADTSCADMENCLELAMK